jgi:hypothetical protein
LSAPRGPGSPQGPGVPTAPGRPGRRRWLWRALGWAAGSALGAPAVARAQAAPGAAPAAGSAGLGASADTADSGAPAAAGAPPAAGTALHRLHTGDLGALVAIDATLDGRPWRCLVDSGASIALVTPARAARERLSVVARSRVATAGGTLTLERVALPPVAVGGRRVDAPQALVLDLAQSLGEVGAAVDGLLGAPALRDAVTRFDLAGGHLAWHAAPPTASTPTSGGRTAWPLRWDQGLPVIDLALGDRPPAPFLLDTGNAGALVIFARHAAGLVPDLERLPRTTARELGGTLTVHQALLARCSAPGWVGRDLPTVFEAGATARRGAHFDRLAGSVGLALFGAGAFTLDGPGGRLEVELPGLPEVAPPPGGFGFALRSVAGGAPQVSAVFDGGPAARAGVPPGARLLALDGEVLTGVAAGEVWRRLAGVERATFRFEVPGAPDTTDTTTTLARERFFVRWA